MRREIRKCVMVLGMGVAVAGSVVMGYVHEVSAQIPQSPAPSGSHIPESEINPAAANSNDPAMTRMKHERQVAVDNDRHKRMVADADKLLELATELKAQVDRSTPNETSVTAFNKADQIEKLAHDVKQRLKE